MERGAHMVEDSTAVVTACWRVAEMRPESPTTYGSSGRPSMRDRLSISLSTTTVSMSMNSSSAAGHAFIAALRNVADLRVAGRGGMVPS